MKEDLIFARIECLIKEKYGDIKINASSNLVDDLGLDSLDVIEMWLMLEEEFTIDVPDEEAKQMQTVQDCVNIVKKYENISNKS